MLSKDEFVRRILDGAPPQADAEADSGFGDAMLEGFDGFDVSDDSEEATGDARFAQLLLEESGFGRGETLPRGEVVLGDQKTNRFLPHGATYWAKTPDRPFHILLFDLELKGSEILGEGFFRQNDQLEDALHRIVQDALEGFERGGEGRTADRKRGAQTETLCVVSVLDDRPFSPEPGCPNCNGRGGTKDEPCLCVESRWTRIVCFGTKCVETAALETFDIREEPRHWPDRALAEEHLRQRFLRHFSKLASGSRWQEAFVSGPERKKAQRLLDEGPAVLDDPRHLKALVRDLLDEIAKSYGVTMKTYSGPRGEERARLPAYDLPANHSLGVDPKAAWSTDLTNPLQGLLVFDADERLLGYVVYSTRDEAEARRLRSALRLHNHFHNVLLLYPDDRVLNLELWQGGEVSEGRLLRGSRRPRFEGVGGVVQLLARFLVISRSQIQTPRALATELAWRAQHLRSLAIDELHKEENKPKDKRPLRDLLEVFNQALATLDETQFADAYAQTITYGLLAARWLSSGRQDVRFARKNIDALLPSTSPFLHDLFQRLVNSHFDQNLSWLLDDITSLLSRTMVAEVFQGEDDPSIHFYQDFLDAYDPQIRKDQGVYYTPDEVVSYIVRTAHTALQERFGLELGLADTTSWTDFAKAAGIDVPEGVDGDQPFVQVLDPATGTGTFLLRVIEVIHETMMAQYAEQGLDEKASQREWVKYVRAYLLPRINGFELMMAPYIVSHLRLGLALQQTGFVFGDADRLRVFLTNTLEPRVPQQLAFLGANVAEEANQAAAIKTAGVVTVLVGNPPYAIQSANLTSQARALVEPFKFVNGSKIKEKGALQLERNLNDDYVKFFSIALSTLSRAPSWVCALITNRAYTDNPTLRGLRWALLDAANSIDLVDLHGDIKRKESPPGGSQNDNIFNILQGVAITVLVHDRSHEEIASVRRADVWGSRIEKLSALASGAVSLNGIKPRAPNYAFVDDSNSLYGEYDQFVRLDEAAQVYSNGLVTARDGLVIDFDRSALEERIRSFALSPESTEDVCARLGVRAKKGWDAGAARVAVAASIERSEDWFMPFLYRPFESAWIFYHPALIQTMASTTWHMCAGENVAILVPRTVKGGGFRHVMVTRQMSEAISLSTKTSVNGNCFPLWVYDGAKEKVLQDRGLPRSGSLLELSGGKTANIEAAKLGASPRRPAGGDSQDESAFYYAAAVLHSADYRQRYNDLLSRGFPRIPRAASDELVEELAAIGRRLPDIYDLTGEFSQLDTSLELIGDGDGIVEQAKYDKSLQAVWINRRQRVSPITEIEWGFMIGDYPVIKRWLVGGRAVTRKGRALADADLTHLARVGRAITELLAVPHQVDRVIAQHGGWPSAFLVEELESDE